MIHERNEWEDITVEYHGDEDHAVETWTLEDFSDIVEPIHA